MRGFPAAAVVLATLAPCALADDPPDDAKPDRTLEQDVSDLRRRMAEMEERHRTEIEALKAQLGAASDSGLVSELDDVIDRLDAIERRVPAETPRVSAGSKLIEFSLNGLFTAGASTEREPTIGALQVGDHDPKKRGFTAQNVELSARGAVDPYFDAAANLDWKITPDGETSVELEEAYLVTTGLPGKLQVKAGQFFTEFGRQNPTHPHQWSFVDAPIVAARFFGPDGMRGPGARVSWFAPTEFPLEISGTVQNANGETMVSFLSTDEAGVPLGRHSLREVRTLGDLVWTGRAAASFDATPELPVLLGVSGAFGPSGAAGSDGARILGADVTGKWKPLDNDHGFPFVSVRAEWMQRVYGFDAFRTAGGTAVSGGDLRDDGWYAQADWGFTRDWTLGARLDQVSGPLDHVSGLDDRRRCSLAVTYYTSEFAKIRLQVNRDHAEALPRDVTSVWLQFELNLGAHGAHRF